MFSEKEKNAYKKIKAPVSLREKIVTPEKTEKQVKPFFGRNLATMAACLIIAICIIPQMDIIKKGNDAVVTEQKTITDEKEREIVDASFSEPLQPEERIVEDNKTVYTANEAVNQPVMTRALPEPREIPAVEEPLAETEKISLPVNLNCGENSKVSVSDGILYLHLPEENTKISGSEISATGDIWLVWEIENPDTSKTYEMKVSDGTQEKNYILTYKSGWNLEKITN